MLARGRNRRVHCQAFAPLQVFRTAVLDRVSTPLASRRAQRQIRALGYHKYPCGGAMRRRAFLLPLMPFGSLID